MWLSAIKLAAQAGSHIYKKKKQTQMLHSLTEQVHQTLLTALRLENSAFQRQKITKM